MVAAILERSGRSRGAQPRRLEHGLGRGHRAARRGPRARARSGLFEVDEAWLPRVARRRRAAQPTCSRTCSATSSTATASWSCWPTAGPSWWPAATGRARFVLNADDPLVADLGRGREGVVYFGVDDDSQALPELSTRPTPSTAATAARPTPTTPCYMGHLGHYRCPNCGRERPTPDGGGRAGASSRACRGPDVTLATPGRQARAAPAPPGPLQRLQRGRRGGPGAGAGRAAGDGARARWRASAARSAGWRRSRWTGGRCRSCWSRTPRAPTRCCAR